MSVNYRKFTIFSGNYSYLRNSLISCDKFMYEISINHAQFTILCISKITLRSVNKHSVHFQSRKMLQTPLDSSARTPMN